MFVLVTVPLISTALLNTLVHYPGIISCSWYYFKLPGIGILQLTVIMINVFLVIPGSTGNGLTC